LVIFDADPDGFGSAFAAWNALGTEDTFYMETLHGSDLPDDAFGYNNVYILDLSFPRVDYDSLIAAGSKVTVIDHHPSAKQDIEALRLNPVPYDTERAACVQAWEFFNPYHATPGLLQYVADRDTWKFELPYSDEINAYIYTLPLTFNSWQQGSLDIEYSWNTVLQIGRALVGYRKKLVDEMAEDVTLVHDWQGVHSVTGIPWAAAPVLWSEVGHKLLNDNPHAPFSVTYKDFTTEGYRKYNLRSEDHREDVGEFAKVRGGGGHHNAAGFKRPLDDIWKEGYENID
jgi:oligoribonuclease NrnB/cAMP/cGMP phosphodiesterase (DHH superfamily)